jgi:acetyl-CoA carboxylase biotin carboxylase subunit
MLRRILIANRGEIAARILRTCRRLGIETVLAASEADMDSVPARLADRVICIGPAPAAGSYLNVDSVMAAARRCGAQAIHPGYGFLSENSRLARACAEQGMIFIGPGAEQLAAVGDKLSAREHAIGAGLPVVPGGAVQSIEEGRFLAQAIGYPVLLKAVGGGGGRGMKPVHEAAALDEALQLAAAEAQAAFADARMYLERYIGSGRHVEVQILGDGSDVIHFGTRDCSIQRRFQKLVEEAPAPHLSAALRANLHAAAVALARHLRYRGLGTVEFLVDEQQNFYFLEMNARIQVEHPVTEAICGVDLVAEQIAVAEGQPLRLAQAQVVFSGHAVECRINAEDWTRDFRPSPGTLSYVEFPVGAGIRVDTHVQAGAQVPPYYDSLLAKLIVHGSDRPDALRRLHTALDRCVIRGVDSNLGLHTVLLDAGDFQAGGVHTGWLPGFLERHAAAGGAHG